MKGKLFLSGWENWLLRADGVVYPIHPQHSFWLKMFAEEEMEVAYEKQAGEVIIKATKPDTHYYTQD